MGLFIGEFVLLGLAAGVVGCALGFVQFVLAGLLGGLVGVPLPAPGAGRWPTGWRWRCCSCWVLRCRR
jgi:putative ABC transport system permease protein